MKPRSLFFIYVLSSLPSPQSDSTRAWDRDTIEWETQRLEDCQQAIGNNGIVQSDALKGRGLARLNAGRVP